MKIKELIDALSKLNVELEMYVAIPCFDEEMEVEDVKYADIEGIEPWNDVQDDPMHYTLIPGDIVSG